MSRMSSSYLHLNSIELKCDTSQYSFKAFYVSPIVIALVDIQQRRSPINQATRWLTQLDTHLRLLTTYHSELHRGTPAHGFCYLIGFYSLHVWKEIILPEIQVLDVRLSALEGARLLLPEQIRYTLQSHKPLALLNSSLSASTLHIAHCQHIYRRSCAISSSAISFISLHSHP